MCGRGWSAACPLWFVTHRNPISETRGCDDAATPCIATSGDRRELNGAGSVSATVDAGPVRLAAAGAGAQTEVARERRRRRAEGGGAITAEGAER